MEIRKGSVLSTLPVAAFRYKRNNQQYHRRNDHEPYQQHNPAEAGACFCVPVNRSGSFTLRSCGFVSTVVNAVRSSIVVSGIPIDTTVVRAVCISAFVRVVGGEPASVVSVVRIVGISLHKSVV